MAEITNEILDAIGKRARNGKISCKVCFRLAEEFEVTPRTIGDGCNKAKVKIVGCQLGCFK